MTDLPEMVPSAEERASTLVFEKGLSLADLQNARAGIGAFLYRQDIAEAINQAVLAERARLLAALREPSDDLLGCREFSAIVLDCARAIHSSEIPFERILRAVADWLEHHDG